MSAKRDSRPSPFRGKDTQEILAAYRAGSKLARRLFEEAGFVRIEDVATLSDFALWARKAPEGIPVLMDLLVSGYIEAHGVPPPAVDQDFTEALSLAYELAERVGLGEIPARIQGPVHEGRYVNAMLHLAALAEAHAGNKDGPTGESSGTESDPDYQPASWFRERGIGLSRVRHAASAGRPSMRVRKVGKGKAVRYSASDARRHWPDDIARGERKLAVKKTSG
jgi:hypothetical protein